MKFIRLYRYKKRKKKKIKNATIPKEIKIDVSWFNITVLDILKQFFLSNYIRIKCFFKTFNYKYLKNKVNKTLNKFMIFTN